MPSVVGNWSVGLEGSLQARFIYSKSFSLFFISLDIFFGAARFNLFLHHAPRRKKGKRKENRIYEEGRDSPIEFRADRVDSSLLNNRLKLSQSSRV